MEDNTKEVDLELIQTIKENLVNFRNDMESKVKDAKDRGYDCAPLAKQIIDRLDNTKDNIDGLISSINKIQFK